MFDNFKKWCDFINKIHWKKGMYFLIFFGSLTALDLYYLNGVENRLLLVLRPLVYICFLATVCGLGLKIITWFLKKRDVFEIMDALGKKGLEVLRIIANSESAIVEIEYDYEVILELNDLNFQIQTVGNQYDGMWWIENGRRYSKSVIKATLENRHELLPYIKAYFKQ